MTQNEQALKVKLMEHLEAFTEDASTELDGAWAEFAYFPDNLVETMADASMAVMLAIKGTNKYHDENG